MGGEGSCNELASDPETTNMPSDPFMTQKAEICASIDKTLTTDLLYKLIECLLLFL